MMKHATRITRGIGGALALAVAGVSSGSVLPPVSARDATAPALPVATVNGVAVTQSSLHTALAAAGRHDTPATRHEFKQRLIACELLRQAARRAQRRQAGEGPRAPLTVSPAGALVCAAPEIRPYVLKMVRPPAVTEAQVRARYAALARVRALPAAGSGRGRAGYLQVAECLRTRMEAERLDGAIRALADRLLEQADITQ